MGHRGLKGVAGHRGPGAQGRAGTPAHQGRSRGLVAPASRSPASVASLDPSTDPSSVASWTQPAGTIANVYWRVNVTTPGGSCLSTVAEHVGQFQFWLNDTTDLSQDQSSNT